MRQVFLLSKRSLQFGCQTLFLTPASGEHLLLLSILLGNETETLLFFIFPLIYLAANQTDSFPSFLLSFLWRWWREEVWRRSRMESKLQTRRRRRGMTAQRKQMYKMTKDKKGSSVWRVSFLRQLPLSDGNTECVYMHLRTEATLWRLTLTHWPRWSQLHLNLSDDTRRPSFSLYTHFTHGLFLIHKQNLMFYLTNHHLVTCHRDETTRPATIIHVGFFLEPIWAVFKVSRQQEQQYSAFTPEHVQLCTSSL